MQATEIKGRCEGFLKRMASSAFSHSYFHEKYFGMFIKKGSINEFEDKPNLSIKDKKYERKVYIFIFYH